MLYGHSLNTRNRATIPCNKTFTDALHGYSINIFVSFKLMDV